MYTRFYLLILLLIQLQAVAQEDTAKSEILSFHAQVTVINQYKPAFNAKYSGDNSLKTNHEDQTSITSTFFAGSHLWKNASIYINPEIAGGSGLSGALGVAAATNGETYRIGDPAPSITLARLFFHQEIPLGGEKEYLESSQNQLGGMHAQKYFAFTIGKICVADYFDNNTFSHDPRTQFLSWGLMSNGAWDYPANIKGYTPSVIVEYITPKQELRYHISLVPFTANSDSMNWNIAQASGNSLEYTRTFFTAGGYQRIIRLMAFYNTANMGNYKEAIARSSIYEKPAIIGTRAFGRSKYGITLNCEAELLKKQAGIFIRAGWNDGTNETWMFTEIDETLSAGFSLKGRKWKRPNDIFGIADVYSGISAAHRNYLKMGGDGFILGDGHLHYGLENVFETYYAASLTDNIFLSATYQRVKNPGYNRDRGPVNVFSLRFHMAI